MSGGFVSHHGGLAVVPAPGEGASCLGPHAAITAVQPRRKQTATAMCGQDLAVVRSSESDAVTRARTFGLRHTQVTSCVVIADARGRALGLMQVESVVDGLSVLICSVELQHTGSRSGGCSLAAIFRVQLLLSTHRETSHSPQIYDTRP